MIRDKVLFPKTGRRPVSCSENVNALGINMGICVLLTTLVALAAIIGCIVLLVCVKCATRRDKRRIAKARAAREAAKLNTTGGGIITETTTLPTNSSVALTDTTEKTTFVKNDNIV
uniref:Uncharacterized protein n=1 Tax=Caenorhabditis japonica TaxID=281687 RepID=A0A8R1DZW2_CAEJA